MICRKSSSPASAHRCRNRSKRSARPTSHVEVISAEDIGKMPDKNVADSLPRVPGVTTSSASANEGGFDENDRVSMRGTNPSLTQTLINGHNVGSGDWFVLNQTGTVGRSVSYTLLPSELIDKVVVHKSSQASLVEGGVAGSIDIITRKPLDFQNPSRSRLRPASCMPSCPTRPMASTARWATGRTTPTLSASWSRASGRRATCAAMASKSSATTPLPTGSPVALSNPGPRRRAVPGHHRRRAVPAEARAQGRLDRRPAEAERQLHARRAVLHLETRSGPTSTAISSSSRAI